VPAPHASTRQGNRKLDLRARIAARANQRSRELDVEKLEKTA
jgi:hypothetical protein